MEAQSYVLNIKPYASTHVKYSWVTRHKYTAITRGWIAAFILTNECIQFPVKRIVTTHYCHFHEKTGIVRQFKNVQ